MMMKTILNYPSSQKYHNLNPRRTRNHSTLLKCLKNAVFSLSTLLIEVTFMLTRPPIDPVVLVREICRDTLAGNKRTRWAQRLTPIQSTCYANLPDFRTMCEKILEPIFVGEEVTPIKVIRWELGLMSMLYVLMQGIISP
jgi:hypothetical protein